jgi:hypothetical protein
LSRADKHAVPTLKLAENETMSGDTVTVPS